MVSALGRWLWSISLFICLPGLSLALSALFRWSCSISIHLPGLSLLMSALVRWARSISIQWCPPFAAGHVAFLFFCLPGGLSLVCPCLLAMKHFHSFVSQVRHCWCHVAFHFYSFVFQVCHWWCPPLSVGHEAFLFICFPGPLLLLFALFRWPCSISIHLSPQVSALFVGHAAFLFISLPGLSLLVSALFHWRCNMSIHLFSRSVTAGVRPFPLGMQHFYSFVSRVCHWCCRPFPLVM